jgi:hypothetical protein
MQGYLIGHPRPIEVYADIVDHSRTVPKSGKAKA